MTVHELAQPLRTLAAALAHVDGLPVTAPADLCVAAAHDLTEQAARIADLEFQVAQVHGTARPFAPKETP